MRLALNLEGVTMANLTSALPELGQERKQAQAHVEKLDQAISLIESLNVQAHFRKQADRRELYLRLRGGK